jgi:NADPH:quinone reductase-like Zn-dependent oxidoreductase
MRVVRMHQTGGPEVLQLEQADTPRPADGEVLVRVRAVSINPIDWKYRRGMQPIELPAVLGSDVSGTVEVSRAEGFAEGDEVFGLAAGAYAELAVASAGALAHKPAGISHEQAAAIPVAGLTAWQALFDRGGLQAGQSALVAGAAGGVGHFAVQLARNAGARVVGTGSGRNREFVLGLGAAQYIDYTSEDVAAAASEIDVAFDTVGGETTPSLIGVLRTGGILVTIAAAPPERAAAERGVRAELLSMSPNAEQLARIAQLVADGTVHVEIARTFSLADVGAAHALSEQGHTRGKLVLILEPS